MYIIEPQGMHTLKPLISARGQTVHTIFLLPPSLEILQKRLSDRGTETPEQYTLRIETAQKELAQKDMYDFHITNDDFHEAATALITLLT